MNRGELPPRTSLDRPMKMGLRGVVAMGDYCKLQAARLGLRQRGGELDRAPPVMIAAL